MSSAGPWKSHSLLSGIADLFGLSFILNSFVPGTPFRTGHRGWNNNTLLCKIIHTVLETEGKMMDGFLSAQLSSTISECPFDVSYPSAGAADLETNYAVFSATTERLGDHRNATAKQSVHFGYAAKLPKLDWKLARYHIRVQLPSHLGCAKYFWCFKNHPLHKAKRIEVKRSDHLVSHYIKDP